MGEEEAIGIAARDKARHKAHVSYEVTAGWQLVSLELLCAALPRQTEK